MLLRPVRTALPRNGVRNGCSVYRGCQAGSIGSSGNSRRHVERVPEMIETLRKIAHALNRPDTFLLIDWRNQGSVVLAGRRPWCKHGFGWRILYPGAQAAQ